MSRNLLAAIAVGLLIVVAALALGGRFAIHSSEQGNAVYVVDRFTGMVKICNSAKCWPVPDLPADAADLLPNKPAG